MKITRRELVVATVASSGIAVHAVGQTNTATASDGVQKQAREDVQRNAEALAKFSLPITTEPAFQFKA